MNEIELRLECLRLAASLDVPADRVVGFAERLFTFVMGLSASEPSGTR